MALLLTSPKGNPKNAIDGIINCIIIRHKILVFDKGPYLTTFVATARG